MGALEEVWPQVRRRLIGTLERRGTRLQEAEDISQEVAERIIRKRVPFDSADDLYRWARRVAVQLAIDRHRRTTRHAVQDLDDDVESDFDTATIAENRQRLRQTVTALGRLSPRDRNLILEFAFDETKTLDDRRAQVRTNVARRRARVRLEEIVGRSVVAPIAVARFATRRRRAVDPDLYARCGTLVAQYAAALALVLPTAGAAATSVAAPRPGLTSAPKLALVEVPDSRSSPSMPVPRSAPATVRGRATVPGPAKGAPVGQTLSPPIHTAVASVTTYDGGGTRTLMCVERALVVDRVCLESPAPARAQMKTGLDALTRQP